MLWSATIGISFKSALYVRSRGVLRSVIPILLPSQRWHLQLLDRGYDLVSYRVHAGMTTLAAGGIGLEFRLLRTRLVTPDLLHWRSSTKVMTA